MRKSVKQQLALRVLSTAALMAMVSSIATAAFADTYDLNKGSVTVETKENGITYVTQLDNTQKDGYARNDKDDILHDYQDKTGVTITSGGEKTSNTITVETAKDQTTDVTLQDVHIETEGSWNNTGSAPIEIKGNGDTNLELNGDNTVLSGDSHHAAIEKADKNGHGTLTIKDDLNDDNSTPKDKDENGNAAGGDTGKLLAGGYNSGAGIGGGSYHDGKNYANTSNITITGGKITACGGYYGAGIGGGEDGDASNIRIEGNADVAASGENSAGIGSGYQSSGNSDITITGNATVDAASAVGCGIGDGHLASGKVTVTISGHASVNAEAFNSSAAIGSDKSSATVNIEDHADVTAVGYGVAIGTGYGHEYNGGTSTVINITGGTVNAVTRDDSGPAIGTVKGNLDLTINSSTGKTTVNAYTTSSDSLPLIGTADHYDSSTHKYDRISPSEGAEYNEDGSSNLGEDNAAIINSYCNTPLGTGTYDAPKTLDDYAFRATYEPYGDLYHAKHTLSDKNKGDLTKVVHNRKYMEEHPEEIVDINKLEDEDLHDWQLVGKVVEPTTEEDGWADYICNIDKCGQIKHVVLPKLTPEPSEPDVPGDNTPDTPNKPDTPKQPDVPSTPEVTPADPAVTPDAVQADAAPADAAVAPAAAQNVVQDAKPEAAATAAVSAAALPQTGANWLAVAGSALSGLFLLAAGFVLDRKDRRMN